jgi:hypothetical protein
LRENGAKNQEMAKFVIFPSKTFVLEEKYHLPKGNGFS